MKGLNAILICLYLGLFPSNHVGCSAISGFYSLIIRQRNPWRVCHPSVVLTQAHRNRGQRFWTPAETIATTGKQNTGGENPCTTVQKNHLTWSVGKSMKVAIWFCLLPTSLQVRCAFVLLTYFHYLNLLLTDFSFYHVAARSRGRKWPRRWWCWWRWWWVNSYKIPELESVLKGKIPSLDFLVQFSRSGLSFYLLIYLVV